MDLANCAEDVLQAVINRCDREDLFLLRQVSRRFRTAVNRRIRRIGPGPQWLPKLAAECPNVEVLDLRKYRGAEELPAIQALPRLRELLNFHWEAEIAPLPGVTRLLLTGETDLNDIATIFPALQVLQLHYGLFSDTDVPELDGLAGTLTALELSCTAFYSVNALMELQTLDTGRLQSLSLKDCSMDGEVCSSDGEEAGEVPGFPLHFFFSLLASCTSLHTLCLDRFDGLTANGVEQLTALTRLTSLGLDHLDINGRQLAQLTRLTGLAELNIGHAAGVLSDTHTMRLHALDRYPPSLLRVLAGFSRLAKLDVSGCGGRAFDDEFAALTALSQLRACDTAVLEEPGALRSLTWLRALDLERTVRSEAELQHLSGLVSLTRLSLGSAAPDLRLGDGLRWLAGMTALQELSLLCGGIRLLRGALANLAPLPALQRLSLPKLDAPEELRLLERLQLQQLHLTQNKGDEVPPGLQTAVERGRRARFRSW